MIEDKNSYVCAEQLKAEKYKSEFSFILSYPPITYIGMQLQHVNQRH